MIQLVTAGMISSRTLLPQLAYIGTADRRLDTATVTANYYMRYGANIAGKTPCGRLPGTF